jgi:uncharacterized membrane protein YkvA (DUF1232 family)
VKLSARILLVPVVRRLPVYGKLAWRVIRDPRVRRRHKAVMAAGAGYVLSPVDLLPGFIPVLGQMDDIAVMLLSLRATLRLAPPDVAAQHLAAVGLTWAQIDSDLAALAQAGGLIAAGAARIAGWVAAGAGRMGMRAAVGAGRWVGRAVRRGRLRWRR